MEKVVISKIVNNALFVPLDFLNGITSFVFTYVNPDIILVYPEEKWSPQNLLVGVNIEPKIYEQVLDYMCINSYVVKIRNGKFKIPNNFIEKLSFSNECRLIKTDYGFYISSIKELQNTLVLKL